MWNYLKRSLVVALFLSCSFRCASGPELEKYSRREIDRPYTLPKGVANWHILTNVVNVTSNNGSQTQFGFSPLIWESSLADDWNLLWLPLPLGVSHQFVNNAQDRLGFAFVAPISYRTNQGIYFKPTLAFSERRKISKDLAIDIIPALTVDLMANSNTSLAWSASLAAGPVFQINDEFALKPTLLLSVNNNPYLAPIGLIQSDEPLGSNLLANMDFNLGMRVAAVWSFARQWDLRPSVAYTGVASQSSARSSDFIIDFVHFW